MQAVFDGDVDAVPPRGVRPRRGCRACGAGRPRRRSGRRPWWRGSRRDGGLHGAGADVDGPHAAGRQTRGKALGPHRERGLGGVAGRRSGPRMARRPGVDRLLPPLETSPIAVSVRGATAGEACPAGVAHSPSIGQGARPSHSSCRRPCSAMVAHQPDGKALDAAKEAALQPLGFRPHVDVQSAFDPVRRSSAGGRGRAARGRSHGRGLRRRRSDPSGRRWLPGASPSLLARPPVCERSITKTYRGVLGKRRNTRESSSESCEVSMNTQRVQPIAPHH
ncbi:LigA [Thermomonospora curvata DSM 43183]|uniref:LigA n=1 Tax=Thermomonospora curvata (strain ATCC 19995 / DSM 43183 / JCM 3096 / KCTC 9072 / NBRC 15933 / NCIMB 10081 / Henssen B9) TaxID=471852 RepID=D1A4V8_THECD|nr:LigA [Thermomonospora curvata DSM 43183]